MSILTIVRILAHLSSQFLLDDSFTWLFLATGYRGTGWESFAYSMLLAKKCLKYLLASTIHEHQAVHILPTGLVPIHTYFSSWDRHSPNFTEQIMRSFCLVGQYLLYKSNVVICMAFILSNVLSILISDIKNTQKNIFQDYLWPRCQISNFTFRLNLF